MEEFAESTRLRPTIMTLASLIPGVSFVAQGANEALLSHVRREQHDRLDTLIEELESGREDFQGPLPIQRSQSAIHAAYATIEATLRTSRRQKIRAFARLLKAGLEEPPRISLENEHEDYLKILDELSHRELALLSVLSKYERDSIGTPDENALQRSGRFWPEFQRESCELLSIPSEEFSGLLSRLARTGMYEPIVGAYYGYEGGQGTLTGAYKRLEELIGQTDWLDSGRIV